MNSSQNDGISILLANRSYLYRLLQRIYADEPNSELMEIVTNDHTQEALGLILEQEPEFEGYLDLLIKVREAMKKDPEGTLDKLKSEYTYLFIGPNKLPAPPWESVYVTKERLIFQESTLKVRQAYLEYKFLPKNYPHEADDHLALELDFMAHLAGLAGEKFEEGKVEEAKKVLLDQKNFLEKHLLVWIGDFAEQIQESKTHYFYPQTAKLTARILKVDLDALEEIISYLN